MYGGKSEEQLTIEEARHIEWIKEDRQGEKVKKRTEEERGEEKDGKKEHKDQGKEEAICFKTIS